MLLAVPGDTVAVSCAPAPALRFNVEALKLTPVGAVRTVTVQLAAFPPSAVVTVIVAVPFPTAVT